MARTVDLVFRGDNRSAVRAMTQIAATSEKTAGKVTRDNRRASGSFREMGASAHHVRGTIANLAGAVGFTGLAFGIKDVIGAGVDYQRQQTQLQGALKSTGAYSRSTMEQLSKAAEQLAGHGGLGTAENLGALTMFVTATGSASKAQRDLALATDISRRSGKDFSTVIRAVMMLENGRTTGLSRLGLAVPKVTSAVDALRASHVKVTPAMLAQAKAQDALSSKQQAFVALQARFGGATGRFSNTTAGRLSNLRNEWKSLQERLGAGLLPVMNKLVGAAAATAGWLGKHRAVLYGLLAATAAVTGILTTHAIVTEVLKAKTIALGVAQRFMAIGTGEATVAEEGATVATTMFGLAMDALPIIAIIAGLILLATHFGTVKKVAGIAWKWIKTAAADTFGWIKQHWPLLAGILLAPFTFGVSLIVVLFRKQLLGAARAVWSWIKGAWHVLFDVLSWPFKKAWEVIKGIIDKIKAAIGLVTGLPGTLAHGAGSVLHTLTFGLLHGGGPVRPRYLAAGGPSGTDTVPGWLTPGEYVLNRRMVAQAGLANLEAWRHGAHAQPQQQPLTIVPGEVIVQVDRRTLARATVRYSLEKNARGSTSLVGGAQLTGARSA